MRLETLWGRATSQRLTPARARDELISWFILRAEPQCRRGMAYTSPHATNEEIQRVLKARALAFFQAMASPFDAPTWADLRRVKKRMLSYLLPDSVTAPRVQEESAVWDRLLVDGSPLSAAY